LIASTERGVPDPCIDFCQPSGNAELLRKAVTQAFTTGTISDGKVIPFA
jgi:hypothetical protein